MSFTGDLEHLPIVDVIQLLYSTRKSGILWVKCRKGESNLVFKDGYIVSASHLNNSIRIGTILVNMNMVAPEAIEQALNNQNIAGKDRKPLIVTLLEMGLVNEHDAYKGLEHLIEMTIVEILTWKKGTFHLDVLSENISDEYRYYPGKLNQEINVDTQSILMDALRIFDEKVRDGEIVVDGESEEDVEEIISSSAKSDTTLSVEDLGLDELDQIERKIPKVFKGLKDIDPSTVHREKLKEINSNLSESQQEELIHFLCKYSTSPNDSSSGKQPVIFISTDDLLMHSFATVCKHFGMFVFTTNELQNIEPIITQSLGKNVAPILVIDAPDNNNQQFSADKVNTMRQIIFTCFPEVIMIQLANTSEEPISLMNYFDNVAAVIPRPFKLTHAANYLHELYNFLNIISSIIKKYISYKLPNLSEKLVSSITALHSLKEVPDIVLSILHFTSKIYDRCITLIVREHELIAEKSIGIKTTKGHDVTPALGVKIPFGEKSFLHRIIENGQLYFGLMQDETIKSNLYKTINAPINPTALLLPVKSQGKTIALIYADFGNNYIHIVDNYLLEVIARYAELVLENALYRKKFEKVSA